MTEDQDNAGEVIAGAVRMALTAAGQLAEQAARRREADLNEAERESAARVATLQSQLTVERELALQSVRDVVQRGNGSTVDEVVHAWSQARSWDEPAMAVERISLEDCIGTRFDVNASSLLMGQAMGGRASGTAVSLDVQMKAEDKRHRDAAPGRVSRLQTGQTGSGVDDEAQHALALARQSHPTQASLAARMPRTASTGTPSSARRGKTVEVPGRGR